MSSDTMTGDAAPAEATATGRAAWPVEFWLLSALTLVAAIVVFRDGIALLGEAWTLPEYTHGPLIPVISLVLLHRQISRDGGLFAPGSGSTAMVAGLLAGLAGAMALFGALSGLAELSAYGIVVFAAALMVVALGWPCSARFWHPVVHLCFMLPLPGLIYYGTTTALQGFSSEAGVMFIRMFGIPVVHDGNVIDMGAIKLLVAEACSGLRYMFPILSFSYVLAILYQGPKFKKLLIFAMAVPTAIAINAFRVAAIGVAYGLYDIPPTEGFAHVFEGWVVFLISLALIAACASALSPGGRLSLDTEMGSPRIVAAKLATTRSLPALRVLAAVTCAVAVALVALPDRTGRAVDRLPFSVMDIAVGPWTLRERIAIEPAIARSMAADDIFLGSFEAPGRAAGVELLLAYYEDQRAGGIHSPEICLPGAGWEIETLDRIALDGPGDTAFPAMRAVIRRDLERRVVIYWFDQHGRRTAVDYAAKALLVWDGVVHNRTDGALVRLVTPVRTGETPAEAEIRLTDMARDLPGMLAPHLPAAPGLGGSP